MKKSENRKPDKLRPVKIRTGAAEQAEGSALISMGETRVLCTASVEQGKPRWMKRDEKRGWVTAEYSMLPRSTSTRTRRERGHTSGRTQEIQRLIGRSLRAVTDLEILDKHTIVVDCDVINADGGTRTAAITGGFVALYLACKKLVREKAVPAMPIIDFAAAVSVGIVDGELWLDLDYARDVKAEVDMNVAMTGSGRIIEVQGTAEGKPFTRAQMNKMIQMAAAGIEELIQAQKKSLRVR